MAINETMEMNRTGYIGGSDIPRLLGVSKFGKPKDLAYEKYTGNRETFDNIYVKMGNYFEPRIQEYFDVENVDDKEWSVTHIGDVELKLPIKCHVDGLNKTTGQLIEIKNSKSHKDALITEYYYQIQTYMWALGLDSCTLINLKRQGDVNTKFRQIMLELSIPFMHNFLEMSDGEEISVKTDELIKEQFDEMDLTDSMFDIIEINRDDKAIEEIKEAILMLDVFLKSDIEGDVYREACNFQTEILGYSTLDESDVLSQSEIEEIELTLESTLEQKKIIDAQIKELKEKLASTGLEKVRIGNTLFKQSPPTISRVLKVDELSQLLAENGIELDEFYENKERKGRTTFSKI